MSKRWYQENKRDPWRRDAKSKGYRARSAYKLKQIQEKFGMEQVQDWATMYRRWKKNLDHTVGDARVLLTSYYKTISPTIRVASYYKSSLRL